ncbi:LysR family transcriptional regulator [Burkholderia gladioli]|jgi:DNA-binding transcriptional LysR family regulator|uniref:Bacterial regulatory helix-turn-helix, lysR family protein n=2 Tax=Burkholderia gladioli TaxID=28095 RepID=A0A095G7L2_BURGA|nr:LysR family transcriptional regulator [Burkholderia gladioli]AEA63716.1 Transcriptional regulator, LysR family protein [Burkholderia gladioli BSR3]AJW95324.1 bacterial regulatory helix-turn-helix, lysR family protein [Burkholderia gladioli]ASD82291.1 LysR family transcriptional regulator [Burkholderia gladioli pv. gladioli]ATF87475.1 LysR family transcriptional regulator [Burkholderia gladioli pv. gladioli]AWY52542.1 LysR family transcriptional regulator [Burkholderia gladioli pv. gladioli]
MELRHLRYFLAVAEEGQFTRAAERLAMQQPPLSQQIRLLEEEIGFDLFVRQPRGVELTPAGRAFAQNAELVLETLQQGVAHARRIARGELGTIAVGLTSSAGFHPMTTDAIRGFRAAHPGIEITLAELNAAELTERLANGQLQVAFLRKPVDTLPGIAFEPLLDEPMVAVLPVGHRLLTAMAEGDPPPTISLKALEHEEFILVRRPGAPGMYADFLAACRRQGFVPHVAREVPRMLTGIHMVAAGLGVTLVPASMRRYDHRSAVFCPLADDAGFSAPLHLAHPAEMGDPAAARFVEFVLRQKAMADDDADRRGKRGADSGEA